VIIGNNVLAHVPDLHGFLAGIRTLLKDDGVAVIECPYVRDLIDDCAFDTIYHEHLCYYSVTALDKVLRSEGLYLNHVDHVAVHGGSLRLRIGKGEGVDETVTHYLESEERDGVTRYEYYAGFNQRVQRIRAELASLLADLKYGGATIAAYGAAAKGSTLVNYLGLDARYIDFVVDRNPHKQGLYMPGVHLPIHAPEHLLVAKPSHVLLLVWNFKEEVLDQQREYRAQGGKFIVPVPQPVIV
jgi:hypothetical protein